MKPGDEVLINGTVSMNSIGIEDDECLVQIAGNQFVVIKEDDLGRFEPAPLPDHLACVSKADLLVVLKAAGQVAMDLPGQAARNRLAAQSGELPEVRQGDVWKDAAGDRWFAQRMEGRLRLVAENGSSGMIHTLPSVTRHMTLEWRRPEFKFAQVLHSCEHQASNYAPCKVCGE